MAGRKAIKTKIPEIVNYWARRQNESSLSADTSEAEPTGAAGAAAVNGGSIGVTSFRILWEGRMSPPILCCCAPDATWRIPMWRIHISCGTG